MGLHIINKDQKFRKTFPGFCRLSASIRNPDMRKDGFDNVAATLNVEARAEAAPKGRGAQRRAIPQRRLFIKIVLSNNSFIGIYNSFGFNRRLIGYTDQNFETNADKRMTIVINKNNIGLGAEIENW